MKGDEKERGSSKDHIAPRTPKSPAPSSKGGAKQPGGSGNFDVERSPYGKKLK